ncbi:hypothetical protein PPERSA_01236 [Pseudocohnilembus persalinus]|uniref:Uncharacterized protein n=1 Tax=Pseudocohnilembus persalinus TaxID=266149 RepID=A0A0V0R954_PSEPJ|nr:hypothetical protein PPERSA_01236 [Pseudocohnilembus persalinus]|eukprot:KRX11037.1 hypothetical protein PPERSA_01236 [Pseudocohnilembus persalinus]
MCSKCGGLDTIFQRSTNAIYQSIQRNSQQYLQSQKNSANENFQKIQREVKSRNRISARKQTFKLNYEKDKTFQPFGLNYNNNNNNLINNGSITNFLETDPDNTSFSTSNNIISQKGSQTCREHLNKSNNNFNSCVNFIKNQKKFQNQITNSASSTNFARNISSQTTSRNQSQNWQQFTPLLQGKQRGNAFFQQKRQAQKNQKSLENRSSIYFYQSGVPGIKNSQILEQNQTQVYNNSITEFNNTVEQQQNLKKTSNNQNGHTELQMNQRKLNSENQGLLQFQSNQLKQPLKQYNSSIVACDNYGRFSKIKSLSDLYHETKQSKISHKL